MQAVAVVNLAQISIAGGAAFLKPAYHGGA
jgi:hypothetical protein